MRTEGSPPDPVLSAGEGGNRPVLSPRRFGLLLPAILLLGIALRLLFAPGLCEADDFAYWGIARAWRDGSLHLFRDTSYYAHRVGLWFPAALGMSLLGRGPLAVAAWPLACSILLLFLLLREARRRFGPASPLTLLALFLLASNPLEIAQAGRLLPDVPFAAWAFAALSLHWSALESRGAKALLLWTGAGLAAYGAYLIRSPGLLLLPALGLDLLVRRRLPRAVWAAPAAFLLCQALASWLYWKASGDPFFRQHLLLAQYAKETPGPFLGMTLAVFRPGSLLFGEGLLFLAALILPRFRRGARPAGDLLAFLAFWYLFHEFGSMSLREYRPLVKDLRFFTVLSAPAALFVAARAAALFSGDGTERKGAPPRKILLSLLLVLALFSWHGLNRCLRKRRGLESAVAKYAFVGRFLDRHPPAEPVYTVHWRWPLRLRYFAPGVKDYRLLPPPREWSRLRRGTVVLDHRFRETGWRNPEWPPPPRTWRRILEYRKKRKHVEVFRIGP